MSAWIVCDQARARAEQPAQQTQSKNGRSARPGEATQSSAQSQLRQHAITVCSSQHAHVVDGRLRIRRLGKLDEAKATVRHLIFALRRVERDVELDNVTEGREGVVEDRLVDLETEAADLRARQCLRASVVRGRT